MGCMKIRLFPDNVVFQTDYLPNRPSDSTTQLPLGIGLQPPRPSSQI